MTKKRGHPSQIQKKGEKTIDIKGRKGVDVYSVDHIIPQLRPGVDIIIVSPCGKNTYNNPYDEPDYDKYHYKSILNSF